MEGALNKGQAFVGFSSAKSQTTFLSLGIKSSPGPLCLENKNDLTRLWSDVTPSSGFPYRPPRQSWPLWALHWASVASFLHLEWMLASFSSSQVGAPCPSLRGSGEAAVGQPLTSSVNVGKLCSLFCRGFPIYIMGWLLVRIQ